MMQGRTMNESVGWLSTLYFTKGLLYVVVFVVALLMLRQLGVSMTETTLYVALCYTPWVTKYWWKPLVIRTRSCKQWILLTELLLVPAFSLLAFTLSNTWQTVCMLMTIASLTAVHNVSVDILFHLETNRWAGDHSSVSEHREIARKMADVVGLGLLVMLVGNLQVVYRNAQVYSWRVMAYCVATMCLLLFFWHLLMLPRSISIDHYVYKRVKERLSFHVVLFLLFFIMAPFLQSKMAVLFLVENQSSMGLGLSPQEFGLVMGTIGVIGVTLGISLGNVLIRRNGLASLLLPMAFSMAVPSVIYAFLSYWLPTDIWLISFFVMLEQLTYGFGLSGYLAYQKSLRNKELAKSLMAFTMMLSCGTAGLLQSLLGYHVFFVFTSLLCVLTVGVAWYVCD